MINFETEKNNIETNRLVSAIEKTLQSDDAKNVIIVINQPLEGFYTIKDVMEMQHCSKTTAQHLFNMKEFPACDFGREKIISKQAYYAFFEKRRSKEDYKHWRIKKGA